MRALQPVKGTHDILPEDMRRFRLVFDKAREVAARYGYREMATPIFEFTEVFRRTLGDTSDVVTKEMYTFDTKGGEQVTLRPEATAGVARAFISGGLAQQLPLKFFFAGPMFRHERPQAGRQRQFHQIDIELLGVAQPLGDVEIIAAGAAILDALGVRDKTTLELNTLGDPESRGAYREALVDYFRDHQTRLSEDSRMRLSRNPLRILDSKDEGDRALVADAPLFADYLNPESVAFFDEVMAGLDALGIAYQRNPRLVRGLDYYTHTAFEFTTTALGAQGAVLAGGRYDHLIEQLGGPPTAGTGWAAGVERLVLLMAAELPELRPLAVVPLGEAAERAALVLSERLRRDGFMVELGFSGNMKKRLSRANKMKARAAVILGEDELAKDSVTLRDLETGAQELVPRSALRERLARFR
ncbi:MAG: histidine--tRNA ligase [Kiloniellales bacterium]|nr:histidine--tRNA ligase [Kiloniellales bacterium]